MPTFSTKPSGGLMGSIKNAIAGLGGPNPLQLIQMESMGAQAGMHSALAEKARLEAEQLRKSAADRQNPALMSQAAGDSAGMNTADSSRLMNHLRGVMEQPSEFDMHDAEMAGGTAQPYVTSAPAIQPGQRDRFQNNLAAMQFANMGTGKSTADNIAAAAGHTQGQGILSRVQELIANGDVQGASAVSQGSKPGNAIKLWDNGTGPGTTFNPVTGDIKGVAPFQHVSNPLTGKIEAFNPQTGETKPADGQPAPGWPDGVPTVTGEEFLASLPKAQADQVKAIVEGRQPFPGGMALKTPYWQNMINLAAQYEPGFDATLFNARQATRKSFLGGGNDAQNLKKINTAIGHLDSFDKAAQALNNTDYPMINKILNGVGPEVGATNLAGRLRTFQQSKEAVANELMSVFRGSGASSGDTAKWAESLNQADSPEALRKAVKGAVDLLDSRIESLNQSYRQGMGQKANDADTLQMVFPHARETIERLRSGTPTAPAVVPNTRSRATPNGIPASSPAPTGQTITIGGQSYPVLRLDADGTPIVKTPTGEARARKVTNG